MRALRIHQFGALLQYDEDVEDPTVSPGEVLVELEYIGVNPLDIRVTKGQIGGDQPLPFIPGSEAAGRLDGQPVLVFGPGGHGIGTKRQGMYAQRAAVPADAVLPIPDGVDARDAAAIGVAGRTAHRLVHAVGRVDADDTVLVLGAAGGVGSMLIQLARGTGARVVGQTGSPDKADGIRELGAHGVVVADAGSLFEQVRELRPTVVFDPLGDGFTVAALAATASHGRVVIYGTSAGPRGDIDLQDLYSRDLSLISYSGRLEPADQSRIGVAGALDALATGRIRVEIDDILPLSAGGEAHRRILERRVRGKLLLRTDVARDR